MDLKDGRLARLSRGDPKTAKYYDNLGDPVQTSLHWKKEGACFLHLVDLDAATGMGNNRTLIHRILSEVDIPVQVGGGLRTSADVVEILDWGASRALVGTLVFDRPEEFQKLLDNVGSNCIVVALDYIEDKVVTRGWSKRTEFTVSETLNMLLRRGVKMFLLTAVGRDGLMTGPDIETLSVCARISGAHLIAAGGVGTLDDLVRLSTLGIEEVIVGKALYEGRFTIQEALERFME